MNTFGSASLQFALVDAREARANRARFRRDALPVLDRVNSIYIPAGRYSVRGWVMLPRYEYAQLDPYSTDLRLVVGDTRSADNVQTLKNLSVVSARCATRGLAADPNALYVIELTDDRGVLSNRWFRAPLTAAYNVRAPAYPDVFHPGSLNGGTTWTWDAMLADIWGRMATGSLLNAYPGLPAGGVTQGTPEGWWFTGVGAWTALCDVLDYLGLSVACDLQSATPYTIVQSGATDSTFTALQAKYATNIEDDLEPLDAGSARVPGTVTVLFRRRNTVYGTEETVRYDAPQWDMASYYSVSVAAPAAFSAAVGSHYLWADFTVRHDQDGSPVAADVAQAALIAAERVTQYFGTIYDRTLGYLSQTYAGALPFVTGARVDGVLYYQDDRARDDYGGWRTHIVRGDGPPWEDVWE